MESALTLLQLVRSAAGSAQSSNLCEDDLISQLDSARKHLQGTGTCALSPESSALVVCHITAQVLAFLVQHRPLTVSLKWHKRVIVLELAISSAATSVASSGYVLLTDERRNLCNKIELLFQTLWKTSPTSQYIINGATVMVKLCILLAICWLSYDRVGSASKVDNLLTSCRDLCMKNESTKYLAKWPLYLLGMLNMAVNRDDVRALECFQCAVKGCEGSSIEDGAFYYWHAVALMRNGLLMDAATELDKCIGLSYEPAACLSLQALVHLQAKDLHAASKQLQRMMEIDFTQPTSMFNYGLLLARMENFEAQQQLLEYILELHSSGTYLLMPDGDVIAPDGPKTVGPVFNQRSLISLFPSRFTSVTASMVHRHMAVAAMENGHWIESKQHFEAYLGLEDRRHVFETARDYVYVLLQCRLPSIALCQCEQYLLNNDLTIIEDDVLMTLVQLHLYKADALLCLERVAECCEELQQIVQPKIQGLRVLYEAATNVNDAMLEEIVSCHTQLLNNLAVVVACCSGVDPAMSILRDGLQQYPDCLAIKFNLVLLLLRKEDSSTACAVWVKARGWSLRSETKEATGTVSLGNIASAYQNAALSISTTPDTLISEHVQGDFDGEGGVSAQQLAYLDALILNYRRKSWDSQLVDNSLRYIEYLESRGSSLNSNEWPVDQI